VGGQHQNENDGRKQHRRRKTRGVSLRVRIVAACNEREVTPKEIADREGLPRDTVAYHFRVLEKEGYLRVSRKEPARGLRRHYYVAARRKVITDQEFAEMTKEEQRAASEATLRDLLEHCGAALKTGALDARADSHLSWILLSLDKQGWEELQIHLDWMLERSLQIHEGALARLRKSGEDPIPTTIAIAGFESPASESIVTDSSN
jgi:DNA-binding transcriptional regulator GbsR (MarR family)